MYKITKFWRMYISWKGQQHFSLKELHERYGPIVRTGTCYGLPLVTGIPENAGLTSSTTLPGPNDVSVTDLESVKAVLGTEGLPKGQGTPKSIHILLILILSTVAYLRLKVRKNAHSLAGTTGEERILRRRIWSRGFTSEALKEYQPIITAKGNELLEGLSARAGKELDLTKWLNLFT